MFYVFLQKLSLFDIDNIFSKFIGQNIIYYIVEQKIFNIILTIHWYLWGPFWLHIDDSNHYILRVSTKNLLNLISVRAILELLSVLHLKKPLPISI